MKRRPILALSFLAVACVNAANAGELDQCTQSADHFPESLVGHTVIVDQKGDGIDFGIVYGHQGITAQESFLVTQDNRGLTQDGSGWRTLSFEDTRGGIHHGSASRFKVCVNDGPPMS